MRPVQQILRWKMSLNRFCFRQGYLYVITFLTILIAYLFFFKISGDEILQQSLAENQRSFNQRLADQIFRGTSSKRKLEKCELFSLRSKPRNSLSDNRSTSGHCRRIPPVAGSCTIAEKLFFSERPATCLHQENYNFCHLQKWSGADKRWIVTCNETASTVCISPMSLGSVNEHTGSLEWEEVESLAQLSEKITRMIQPARTDKVSRHYGFCFIQCQTGPPTADGLSRPAFESEEDYRNYYNSDVYLEEEIQHTEQLLILPPQIHRSNIQSKPLAKDAISVNIILVDSVSRQHFFRSLKKSVATLDRIQSSPFLGATVLDFELVQAVRSRTFESLQAIFSGEVDPFKKPFGTQDVPPEPLELSAMLSKFKARGYHTVWLEDLCYLWEWGLAKDLHFLNKSSNNNNTWARMWTRLKESQLDDVAVTLAMCKVLEANGVPDHFHGPDAVCFNGRHQHEYLLEYLSLYEVTMTSNAQPYFAFTMTNVAHEDTGRRVQTLDDSLAKYLAHSSHLPNTLTVIFSDHGNSYGNFMAETEEARVELFHPFMFFIVPTNVAQKLGQTAMESLQVNTHRLVSFVDLHYTLNQLVAPDKSEFAHQKYKVSPQGLLMPVAADRTCDDIPRIMPNLCICQDYDTPVENDTETNLFAYFAVGRLNDEIQRQQQVKLGADGQNFVAFRKCEKLQLMFVTNIRKSYDKDRAQIFKMDLHLQQDEIFFVAVSVKDNSDSQGYHTTSLEMYDRITPYADFSVCADDIDLSLCICDRKKQQNPSDPPPQIPNTKEFASMNVLPDFEAIVQETQSESDCVVIVSLKHSLGAVIFAANTCGDKRFALHAKLLTVDQIVYASPGKDLSVLPGGMIMVGLLLAEEGREWTCGVSVECRVV